MSHNKNKKLVNGHYRTKPTVLLYNVLAVTSGIIFVLFTIYLLATAYRKDEAEIELVKPFIEYVEVSEVQGKEIPVHKPNYEGKASWYSREGCIGCSETLTMANGQPLDDNAMTVAFNHEPLGTRLRLVNKANNMVAYVVVTDTGGFHRHGRILDVTPAVRDTLNMKTDDTVEVYVLE